VAVSFPVTFLVIALGAGLAMAGAILSAQYMGAGRQDMVNHETWRCALNSLW
jgi:Na+-driven multidrug efflux pump